MRIPRLLTVVSLALGCGGPPVADPPAPDPVTATVCEAGQRPVAGTNSCAPVGTSAVPEGFTAEPWGFRPNAPSEPCTGASIALLGRAACEPIDDCDASFPPADAVVAVRVSGAPYADRPDLPVVSSLDAAIARAKSGETIAVDEGAFGTPSSFGKSARFVGRCAARTALQNPDFVVNVKAHAPIQLAFQSLSLIGASKVALLVDGRAATVTLDRAYVHGPGSGAEVGNGATLTATRTVFEGPAVTPNPNRATNGVYAIYGGKIALQGVEVRGFQNALEAESVGTEVGISKSILHEEAELAAGAESLAQIGAFRGARVTIDASHVESAAGRIAIIGAEAFDGTADATSPGNPPASLGVTNSTLVHRLVPRNAGSAIDVLGGATVELENVSVRHESLVGIGASEGATVTLRKSTILAGESPRYARTALYGLTAATFNLEASAIVSPTQFGIVLRGASSMTMDRSVVAQNRELSAPDPTAFLGGAQGVSIGPGGKVLVRDSALVDNEGGAFFLQEGSAQIDGVVLSRTRSSRASAFGVAITAIHSAVAVRTSTITRNQVALAIRGGRALLRDSLVTDHGDAIRLDGVTFVQTSEAREDAVDMQVIAARTTFARNGRLAIAEPLTGE